MRCGYGTYISGAARSPTEIHADDADDPRICSRKTPPPLAPNSFAGGGIFVSSVTLGVRAVDDDDWASRSQCSGKRRPATMGWRLSQVA